MVLRRMVDTTWFLLWEVLPLPVELCEGINSIMSKKTRRGGGKEGLRQIKSATISRSLSEDIFKSGFSESFQTTPVFAN